MGTAGTRETTTPALAARQIRKKLAEAGITARVTSRSRGTSSVSVQLTDQSPKTFERAENIASPHRMGRYDGMNEYYNMDNARDDIPQVSYVHMQNLPSEEMRREIETFSLKTYGEAKPVSLHQIFAGFAPYGRVFWDTRQAKQAGRAGE